mmetsp:Transcript_34431/g.63293  ORF Transcript_34431/g.63293 Transcript_34431/m.63293 type:complete len:160 (-) Transcript_34431:327-806(-)|eukprot:CAMPEP_0201625204 /NCGR_PEP_ID=MMETSP0493-20130528/1102_1 /ASSEMBLY_ACC=CAM_ASM_000838 /TAXON_ID=420259 /ORGANISM="Thalassiosira gravida, Strain GMp14c1" /LENGTH=159 /DNA_ID=CAMNT_0048095163 /DNA_START=210 /DNA_END=689 /DNA_ORIENTATION=-
MVNAAEALSLILVGAFWGCTNPFMRKGFSETKSTKEKRDEGNNNNYPNSGVKSFVSKKIFLLANIKVWLPYVINQLGSVLYYKTLASSNLTLSVPICNATAMVFSSITSAILGERVNQPGRAALGVALVLLGVAVCMYSSEEGTVGDMEGGKVLENGEL